MFWRYFYWKSIQILRNWKQFTSPGLWEQQLICERSCFLFYYYFNFILWHAVDYGKSCLGHSHASQIQESSKSQYCMPPGWFFSYLFVRINVNVALDALLSHVSPGVSAHPFSLAFGALIFTEAAFLALVRGQAFSLGTSLKKTKKKSSNEWSMHFNERAEKQGLCTGNCEKKILETGIMKVIF